MLQRNGTIPFRQWTYVLVIILLIVPITWQSWIEDKIETQIDPREPSSFSKFHMHFTRQKGFDHIEVLNPETNTTSSQFTGNWELYANRYWFETRTPGMLCPMTPKGIAARADWALMVPCLFGDVFRPPKIVFVEVHMLSHFVESTLNFLPNKSWEFILVSGGGDQTTPQGSMDVRFRGMRGFGRGGGKYFDTLVNSPQIIHWYVENPDMQHPKLTSLPTGASNNDNPDDLSDFPNVTMPLLQRNLTMFSSDRIRTGTGQWKDRADALVLCKAAPFCVRPAIPDGAEVSRKEFLSLVAQSSFVACVRGGGVDPSPKAWESILVGSIPIIQKFTIADSYEHLPVAFIDNWNDIYKNPDILDILQAWREMLSPYYEPNSPLRRLTLERLKSSYWVGLMQKKIKDHEEFKRTGVEVKPDHNRLSVTVRDAIEWIQKKKKAIINNNGTTKGNRTNNIANNYNKTDNSSSKRHHHLRMALEDMPVNITEAFSDSWNHIAANHRVSNKVRSWKSIKASKSTTTTSDRSSWEALWDMTRNGFNWL